MSARAAAWSIYLVLERDPVISESLECNILFNIFVLLEKLGPSEFLVSAVETDDFGSELTIVFERIT